MSGVAVLAALGTPLPGSEVQSDNIPGQAFTLIAVVLLALAPLLKWISGLVAGSPPSQSRGRIAFSNAFRIGSTVSNAFGLCLAALGAYMFFNSIVVAGWLLVFALTVVFAPAGAALLVYGSIWCLYYMEDAGFFGMSYASRPRWRKLLLENPLQQMKIDTDIDPLQMSKRECLHG